MPSLLRGSRAAALAFALMAPWLGACPGQLEDPDRFRTGITSCEEIDVARDLLAPRCGGDACHGAPETSPAAGLDLESSGVEGRLVGVVSGCDGRPLIDPDDLEGSYLLEKLYPQPSCGAQMPLGAGALSELEIDCVRGWMSSLTAGELSTWIGAP
jgi:hypothetical protein